MGIGKLFGLSSSSGSSPTSSRPQGGYLPPPSPGSSKADYAYDLNYPRDDDAPPAYQPKKGSDYDGWAADSKKPAPHKLDIPYFPTPDPIRTPTGTMGEDLLQALKNYDIVIILDDSYSMMIKDGASGRTRWDQAWDALRTLVHVGAKYDKNGIEIHLLNDQAAGRTVMTMSHLDDLRRSVPGPREGNHTPTGDVLDTLLLEYRKRLSNKATRPGVKKRIFLIITDGAATDSPEEGIVNAANFLQKNLFPSDQVGIQFIQVGNDKQAEEFLEELDRDLVRNMGEHARDMVDTVKSNGQDLDGNTLIKALTGGFNRRQDRAGE